MIFVFALKKVMYFNQIRCNRVSLAHNVALLLFAVYISRLNTTKGLQRLSGVYPPCRIKLLSTTYKFNLQRSFIRPLLPQAISKSKKNCTKAA